MQFLACFFYARYSVNISVLKIRIAESYLGIQSNELWVIHYDIIATLLYIRQITYLMISIHSPRSSDLTTKNLESCTIVSSSMARMLESLFLTQATVLVPTCLTRQGI